MQEEDSFQEYKRFLQESIGNVDSEKLKPPKIPMNPFVRFHLERSCQQRQKNPNFNWNQLTKKISEQWKTLPEAKKAVYEDLYKIKLNQRTRLLQEFNRVTKNHKILTPYLKYSTKMYPLYQQQFPTKTNQQISKLVSQEWAKLDYKKKKQYIDQYESQKLIFKRTQITPQQIEEYKQKKQQFQKNLLQERKKILKTYGITKRNKGQQLKDERKKLNTRRNLQKQQRKKLKQKQRQEKRRDIEQKKAEKERKKKELEQQKQKKLQEKKNKNKNEDIIDVPAVKNSQIQKQIVQEKQGQINQININILPILPEPLNTNSAELPKINDYVIQTNVQVPQVQTKKSSKNKKQKKTDHPIQNLPLPSIQTKDKIEKSKQSLQQVNNKSRSSRNRKETPQANNQNKSDEKIISSKSTRRRIVPQIKVEVQQKINRIIQNKKKSVNTPKQQKQKSLRKDSKSNRNQKRTRSPKKVKIEQAIINSERKNSKKTQISRNDNKVKKTKQITKKVVKVKQQKSFEQIKVEENTPVQNIIKPIKQKNKQPRQGPKIKFVQKTLRRRVS